VNRDKLKKGDSIHVSRKPSGLNAEKLTILSNVGEGGSMVAYRAEYEKKRGIVKELYPSNITLNRAKNNQLTATNESASNRFVEMRSDFVDVYDALEKIKKENHDNEILNNFIPSSVILYGCPDKNASVTSIYVWMPDNKIGVVFKEYVEKVRKQPKKLSVHKLYNIIDTMITLTVCIKAMHSAGLLHLDIKPSNFLVPYDGSFNINTSAISLFDIDTIYSIHCNIPKMSGTDGYMAPEAKIGKAENRSDIYSIGATLFNAIIICDEINDGRYRQEYYYQIDDLARNSALMNASTLNSNIYLQSALARILKKCLAQKTRGRYSCCGDLIEDLKKAKEYLLPSIVGESLLATHKRLAIVDAEKQGKSDPTAVIQNMLFKNPILDWVPVDSSQINVLVVGAGTYAQKFIDICLQVGQLPSYDLNIKVASREPEADKGMYLQFRPAIDRFVNINGSLRNNDDEIYASVEFVEAKFNSADLTGGGYEENKSTAMNLLSDDLSDRYHYVFIALGDDNINCAVAEAFLDSTNMLNMKCSINFAMQSDKKQSLKKGNPVYIEETISPKTIHSELERMARNVHLSWVGSQNIDIRKTEKDFRKRYNYNASLANALSIKYKLMSIGINISKIDLERAASEFDKKIAAAGSNVFNEMVAYEHRRWVIEKLIDGWSAPYNKLGDIDYEGCMHRGSVKDNLKKLHPCIVRSTIDTPLKERAYTENNNAKWDDNEIDCSLDELDQMSISLHKCFKKHANEVKKRFPLYDGDMSVIRQKITDASDDKTIIAYNNFMLCLKKVLEGSRGYSVQYNHYEKIFLESLDSITDDRRKDVTARIRKIKGELFSVIESNMYRDYKAYDEDLVRRIPFILTYKQQPYIAMAFDDGRAHCNHCGAAFANIASATVLNPAKINYIYYYDGTVEAQHLIRKIQSVLNYFEARRMYTKVHFTVATLVSQEMDEENALVLELKKLKEQKKIVSYSTVECKNEDTAVDALLQSLSTKRIDMFDGSKLHLESSSKSSMLRDKVRQRFAYFEFDSRNKKFENDNGCEYLKYLEDGSFIRVQDVFTLFDMGSEEFYMSEYSSEYEDIWAIYSGNYKKGDDASKYVYNITNWNRICNLLKKYSDTHDIVAVINQNQSKKVPEKRLLYYFPSFGYNAATHIITQLVEFGVLSTESAVSRHTSDTCRADITAIWDVEGALDELFSNYNLFVDHRFIRVERIFGEDASDFCVKIYYDNMNVNGLVLTDDDKGIYQIFDELRDKRYITKLQCNDANPKSINFIYTSQRMKKLMTTTDEVLKAYAYYSATQTGYFDDIACGYNIKCGDRNISEKMDCILTKGFRYLVVNSHAEHLNVYSDMEQACNQVGSVKISEPNDILNIGTSLMNIMEEKF